MKDYPRRLKKKLRKGAGEKNKYKSVKVQKELRQIIGGRPPVEYNNIRYYRRTK